MLRPKNLNDQGCPCGESETAPSAPSKRPCSRGRPCGFSSVGAWQLRSPVMPRCRSTGPIPTKCHTRSGRDRGFPVATTPAAFPVSIPNVLRMKCDEVDRLGLPRADPARRSRCDDGPFHGWTFRTCRGREEARRLGGGIGSRREGSSLPGNTGGDRMATGTPRSARVSRTASGGCSRRAD